MREEVKELIGQYFPVLDYGFVSLVDVMGDDAAIEQAARVSYGAGTRKSSETRGLIRYLLRHKHTTPFEMVELKFSMAMPIFIARQWIRHRTACLTGDVELWFDEPAAIKNGERKRSTLTVKEFYEKWHNGPPNAFGKPITDKFLYHYQNRLSNKNLRSVNEENGEIGHTHITDIWSNGVKDVFEIELENGYKLKCTKDHRLFTNDGWFTLEKCVDLKLENNQVFWSPNHKLATNGEPCYQNYDWMKSQRDAGYDIQTIADNAGISYHTIRKWLKIHNLQYSTAERSKLSGKTQRGQKRKFERVFTPEWRQAIIEARSGEKSNFWKGGVTPKHSRERTWITDRIDVVHKRNQYKCIICKSSENLTGHHIDPVWNNKERVKDFDNVTTLCESCHHRIHYNNLDLAFRDYYEDGADLSIFFDIFNEKLLVEWPVADRHLVAKYVNIVSVKYCGKEETFDISVDGPFHNFIANGICVHNSVNEYSGRYSVMPTLFYTPDQEHLTTQSTNNKQGRTDNLLNEETYEQVSTRLQNQRTYAVDNYKYMLENDVARELARVDLPLSTYTYWYWKIDLHNLFNFLRLRCDSHAQWEIRQYANIMAGMAKRVAPHAFEGWVDYVHCASNLTRLDKLFMNYLTVNFSCEMYCGESGASFAQMRPNYEEHMQQYNVKPHEEFGMNDRELSEFWDKMNPIEAPSFDLDLTVTKDAQFYEDLVKSAT